MLVQADEGFAQLVAQVTFVGAAIPSVFGGLGLVMNWFGRRIFLFSFSGDHPLRLCDKVVDAVAGDLFVDFASSDVRNASSAFPVYYNVRIGDKFPIAATQHARDIAREVRGRDEVHLEIVSFLEKLVARLAIVVYVSAMEVKSVLFPENFVARVTKKVSSAVVVEEPFTIIEAFATTVAPNVRRGVLQMLLERVGRRKVALAFWAVVVIRRFAQVLIESVAIDK